MQCRVEPRLENKRRRLTSIQVLGEVDRTVVREYLEFIFSVIRDCNWARKRWY